MPRSAGRTRKKETSPPGRQPRRGLAVCVLQARLSWLDGPLWWENGGVVWGEERRAPTSVDFSRAQRWLYRLASYPYSGARLLGDLDAWIAGRQARLELAKSLTTIRTPNLDAVIRDARAGRPEAILRLTALLAAEALCVNRLPHSPSLALSTCGEPAEMPLRDAAEEGNVPADARALAALALGGLHHRTGAPARWRSPEAPVQHAYAWARERGMPSEPVLALALLRAGGPELADRCFAAAGEARLRLPAVLLRELVAGGVGPACAVSLAETAVEGDAVAAALMRQQWPPRELRLREAPAPLSYADREELLARLREQLHDLVRACPDPHALEAALRLAARHLEVPGPVRPAVEGFLWALREVRDTLPRDLWGPALELLEERHAGLWDPATLPKPKQWKLPERRFVLWWDARHRSLTPILSLLAATGDAAVTRAILEGGLQDVLVNREWRGPERYRLVLDLVPQLGIPRSYWNVFNIASLISEAPNAAAARRMLQPLLAVLREVSDDPELRRHLLECALEPTGSEGVTVDFLLPRLPGILSHLVRISARARDCVCAEFTTAALVLHRQAPDVAEEWTGLLAEAAGEYAARERRAPLWETGLQYAVTLALAACGGSPEQFHRLMRAALEHPVAGDRKPFQQGIGRLRACPPLQQALVRLYPRQPERCNRLLVRMGQGLRLGEAALDRLDLLEQDPGPPSPGWAEVVELAPGTETDVTRCRAAMAAAEGPDTLPPRVRGLVELPRRLARELAHLEERAARETGRADLALRADSLRARLRDTERLRQVQQEELRDALEEAAAGAVLQAAEQVVLSAFRRRLDRLAGPVPPDLSMDSLLLNAVLLSVELECNQKLLRRLLHAHLEGDHGWREADPANRAFLTGVADAGVDVVRWLSRRPRRYALPAAAGGVVRLHLETEPLRILEMGNHFNTCLSIGGSNAFSAVTNAAELNKRVAYAVDGAGKVIGRKLIAVNEEGKLIGFRTYASIPVDDHEDLDRVFQRYLTRFAAECGLELADAGRVPTLISRKWYDDGVCPWGKVVPAPPKAAALPAPGHQGDGPAPQGRVHPEAGRADHHPGQHSRVPAS